MQQLKFICEVDKLKQIYRQTYISDASRKENDAEHSWHLALMAAILGDQAKGVDILKVMKMVLIHDIVEIDAGDTYLYDEKANATKQFREQKAAERLYGFLPGDQALEYKNLWEEFEKKESAEAKYAAALDRLQPLMLNYVTDGKAWQEHGVCEKQVLDNNKNTLEFSNDIREALLAMVQDAKNHGWLK
ncbi:MAG: HD domain-containing protein [Clostridiales bacterium]|nr:HD domain-containing protein [Clostridiales bacterium]